MGVRLYEWDKTETGWAWIEITDNKVVNLKLREEDNLIIINDDDEAYVDLQLADGITPSDDLPVGVETGRVLQADWWIATWTLILAKTTSWDEVKFLYADDWKLYADNGTGTFKQIYLKPEIDALLQNLATVAHTWDYNDLINKPTLWTAASKDVWTNPWNVPVIWSNWKLDWSIVPSVWVMNIYTVATYGDLTTLSQAVQWDIGIVTNDNKTYILSSDPYSTLSNWTELRFPTWAVSSVNWQTWAVTLTTNDINEANDNLYCTSAEKSAWNNKLDANDVSAVALSGSFADLQNKPVIDSTLSTSSTNAIQNWAVATAINTINWSISTIQWDISALQTTTSGLVSDTAYGSSWDGVTWVAPSKNAVYDKIDSIDTAISTIQGDITSLGTWKQDTLVSGTNIKTINGESILGSGDLDLTSIVITWASFWAFSKACIANGTQHNASLNKYYKYVWGSIVDNTWTESYTMQGLWWFTWVSTSANNCKVTIKVNWLTIWEEDNSSWNYVTKYLTTPITLSEWDIVTVSCTKWSWTIWDIYVSIADFY